MMLADMGSYVIRIDPIDSDPRHPLNALQRGSRSITIDLKSEPGREAALRLIEGADVLIEGFRPGVCERLGVGPDECFIRNPRLVYGRMTAFGQWGPYAGRAGHDINAIAVAGVLEPIGRRGQPPTPPLALVADMGGGGMMLAVGVLAALFHARATGEGQVIDASMTEGAAILGTYMFRSFALGEIQERGTNMLDSGAPFYEVYETSDGRFVAVGAIEPFFYSELLKLLGLTAVATPDQWDRERWPEMKETFASLFKARSQAAWCEAAQRYEACLAPVHPPAQAPLDPNSVARSSFIERANIVQPAPAPRFQKTPSEAGEPPARLGQHTDEVMSQAGFSYSEITNLRLAGVVG
jgi:alpha-methylacyl-CoA racemase